MNPSDVSDEARRLIAQHITSVEQLEILLLLRRHPERTWKVGEVGEQIRTSEASAAHRLTDLADRGLIVANGDGYRYQPPSHEAERAIASLAEAYAERRYTVIDLIFSKPIDNLRVYADAFRFRRDDDTG